MSRSDYIPANDEAFAAQLQTFASGISPYATTLGLDPAQVTSQGEDADYFGTVVANHNIMRNAAQQWTDWKNLMRDGGLPAGTGAPAAPALTLPLAVVDPGVEPRFRALVQQVKGSPNYNESIGAALGIVAPEHTTPEMATIQPNIGATISGGQVIVKWGWGGQGAHLDMCELQVERGDGKGFVPSRSTPRRTTPTPRRSRPRRRSGPTRPSTASATSASASGATR